MLSNIKRTNGARKMEDFIIKLFPGVRLENMGGQTYVGSPIVWRAEK